MFYFGLKVTYFLSITFLKPITAGYLAGKKKEKRLYEVFLFQFFFLISINLVSGAGLEPARHKAQEFKSCVSAIPPPGRQ